MQRTKSKSLKAAAEKLFNELILQFEFAEKLHQDLGPEFYSKLFAELHRLAGVDHLIRWYWTGGAPQQNSNQHAHVILRKDEERLEESSSQVVFCIQLNGA